MINRQTHTRRRPRAGDEGFQLLELTAVLAITSLLALITVPGLLRASARLRVDAAARELVSVMRHSRSYAVRHSAYVGLKFYTDQPQPTWGLYRDGDGDGLRSDDIADGTDPPVEPVRPLRHFGARVGFGFRPGQPPTDPGRPGTPLDRLDDPIRFNRSNIASFSSVGTSSSGTLYVTDGLDWQLAVRLNGRTGRARILTLAPGATEWR
jgi:type II secretory pathway pseudopilin PulG